MLGRLRQTLVNAWNADSGWWNRAFVAALLPLSWLFGALVMVRHNLYKWGWVKSHRLPVPIIVVGNVVVGGVGKTPVTIALVQHLKSQGLRVGVLSRGYGRKTSGIQFVQPTSSAQQVGDEPLLMAHHCQVPVVVGSSRVTAGQTLLAKYPEVQVLICDDGLQHWQLARDLELCVFDERGVGNGQLLPAGPLREVWPRKQLNDQVPCLIVKTAGLAQPHEFVVKRQLADFAIQADGSRRSLHTWGQTPVQALAGIAKPEVFFAMLREQGMNLTHTFPLPDHAPLQSLPLNARQTDIFCTEKDAVKLWPQHPTAWAVPLLTTLPAHLLTAIDLHLTNAKSAKLSLPHGYKTA